MKDCCNLKCVSVIVVVIVYDLVAGRQVASSLVHLIGVETLCDWSTCVHAL